jgi:hypothetical protein
MKKIIFMMLCVASISLTSCDPVTYDTFGGISGTILEMETGEPIKNALLTVSPGGKNTYSGSDGFFEFQDLEAGQYTLTVQATGYSTNRKTVTVVPGEVEQISMTMKKLE